MQIQEDKQLTEIEELVPNELAVECPGIDEQSSDTTSPIQPDGNPIPRYASACRFLAELLVYPEDRNPQSLESHAEMAGVSAPELCDSIRLLMASPELRNCDTYLEIFEINAKCPLYLGHYQFDEPQSCNGAATCGRNDYMIKLKNLYRHFGFELQGGELPDYLPLMLDFLGLSASHPAQKHRRMLVKEFMLPALPPLSKALRAAGDVYAPIATILEQLLNDEAGLAPAPEGELVKTAAVPCNAA